MMTHIQVFTYNDEHIYKCSRTMMTHIQVLTYNDDTYTSVHIQWWHIYKCSRTMMTHIQVLTYNDDTYTSVHVQWWHIYKCSRTMMTRTSNTVNLVFFHHIERARVRLVFLNVTDWKMTIQKLSIRRKTVLILVYYTCTQYKELHHFLFILSFYIKHLILRLYEVWSLLIVIYHK